MIRTQRRGDAEGGKGQTETPPDFFACSNCGKKFRSVEKTLLHKLTCRGNSKINEPSSSN
jgi:hypothetical protein